MADISSPPSASKRSFHETSNGDNALERPTKKFHAEVKFAEAEDEESSDDDELGKPGMAEIDESIGSDFHEEEDLEHPDQPWRIVPGGVSAAEQEAGVLADPRFEKNRDRHEVYTVTLMKRIFINALSGKGKNDDELSGVVDWTKDDPKARYAFVPDLTTDHVVDPVEHSVVIPVVGPVVDPTTSPSVGPVVGPVADTTVDDHIEMTNEDMFD
ncbi:MAG: hypothetical protein M1823_005989, partial [Watsoniomyces obsoletus]